jgi:hypothetical protein
MKALRFELALPRLATARVLGGDYRRIAPRFTPEALKANQALADLVGKLAATKGVTSGADRVGLASRTEAVGRSDSGDHQVAPTGGEPRQRRRDTDHRRPRPHPADARHGRGPG